jgi:hypothetical protein
MTDIELDELAREYYLSKPNEKLKNKLAKACIPYIKIKVNYWCGANSAYDEAEFYSYLNWKLPRLLDSYKPNHKCFKALLFFHLNMMSINYMNYIGRKWEREKVDDAPFVVYYNPADDARLSLDIENVTIEEDIAQKYEDKDLIKRIREKLTTLCI